MLLGGHLHVSFAILFCLFMRRMWCISLAERGNIFWGLKDRSLFDSSKRTSADHFRTFSCAGRNDQLYPELASRCQNYYRCLRGVAYSFRCSEGELFDMNSQECRKEDEVDCPQIPPETERCWLQPDGFYPDYKSECSSYYRCFNESVVEEGKCKGNSIWDTATGSCGFGEHVICSPPSCLGQREGFYPLQGSSCTAYYSCNEGYRTDMLCPLGSLFDYMKKRCVSGPEAVCYEGSCEGRVNGLHSAAHAKCTTFYECFNGVMVELKECPVGEIFDGRHCVIKGNFSCWPEGEGSCGNKPDGIYASGDKECRGFFFCKNRQMIRSFRCDDGFFFNGKTCVASPNFICAPNPPIPDCAEKFDGYYTVEKTNCKTFFRCRNGNKLSEHTCPGNLVFNGQYCISPLFFSCPARGRNIERALPDNGVYGNHKRKEY